MLLSKLRAAGVHLGASTLMACVALAMVFLVWYPTPLGPALGLGGILLILLGVDVVLGPLLTYVVYRPGKPSLRFDLSVIALVQLVAFIYGVYTIAEARPAWLVFNADRFDLAQAHELDDRHLAEAQPEYRHPGWFGPRWVASVNPADPEKRNTLIFESAMGGVDLPQRPDLYVPIEQEADELRTRAKPLVELELYNDPAAVRKVLERHPDADAWLPLMARVRPMTVLIRRADAQPLSVVDLRPWP